MKFSCTLIRLIWVLTCCLGIPSWAKASASQDMQYWVDATGEAKIEDVERLSRDALQALAGAKAQQLNTQSALWLRYVLPARASQGQWLLKFEGPPFMNRIELHQRDAQGKWQEQIAGDHILNALWSKPDLVPVFKLQPSSQGVVWLRVQEHPLPSRPTINLISQADYEYQELVNILSIGGYFGFCLLVLYLGIVYWRVHRDSIFVAYVSYVGCMIGLQLCFTGVGQALLWRNAGSLNDAIVVFFSGWVIATVTWFVRQLVGLERLSPRLNQIMKIWGLFGFIYPFIYAFTISPTSVAIFNVYTLLSIVSSVGVTLWAWSQGEIYGKWTTLAFLPLDLSYVFPGLRLAGVLEDSFLTQYAFLVGSALEIPAFLYLLHRRAKEFGENAARMQSVRSTDALTGLPILPVLELRLGDAMERARRQQAQCAFLIVELHNHAEIISKKGRLAGEQALVLMAASLQSAVRRIDTVCRVSDTRMAILVEPPTSSFRMSEIAQSIVTKGLMRLTDDAEEITHNYCVGMMALPDMQHASHKAQEILSLAHGNLDQVPFSSSKKIFTLPLTDSDKASFEDSKRKTTANSQTSQWPESTQKVTY